MILFFDTETDGLPKWGAPPGHPDQPQIIQLAMLLTDDDGRERCMASMLVRPMRRPIPAAASAVHGITTEDAERFGVASKTALLMWDRFAQNARTIVAHNIKFDRLLVEIEWTYLAVTRPPGEGREWFCTMTAATPIVNMPPTKKMRDAGFNKPKPPKLEECMSHFFGEKLDGAHDALVDVRACARLYFRLRQEKVAA